MNHREIFTPQYTEKSGPGSTIENSAPYREFLEEFIREHAIQHILDLGCGDMEIMSNVDLRLRRSDGSFHQVQYVGVDVIKERVARNRREHFTQLHMHFVEANVFDWLEANDSFSDLLIIKDVLQHWSNAEVMRFLELTLGRFEHMLIVNCNYGETVNRDIATGDWRALDVLAPPFGVPGKIVLRYGTVETGGIKDVVHVYTDLCTAD